jgi:hypothetical protein
MKAIKNLTTAFVAGVMVFMSACDPIEDRDVLKNSFNPDDIELTVTQTANGTGNGITLKMNTPGVHGYWDYKLGTKFTDEVSFVSPFWVILRLPIMLPRLISTVEIPLIASTSPKVYR